MMSTFIRDDHKGTRLHPSLLSQQRRPLLLCSEFAALASKHDLQYVELGVSTEKYEELFQD